jgi:hypothetical protein
MESSQRRFFYEMHPAVEIPDGLPWFRIGDHDRYDRLVG